VVVIAVGAAAAWLLPDWVWQVYTLTITAVSFFTVWLWHRSHRRTAGPMPPEYHPPGGGSSS
jgi:membrane protein implicated in regulation of membrane protease activity